MYTRSIRAGRITRLGLVLLLVLMFSVAHSDIAPFTTQPAYAAGRILCVNVAGGQTTAPCTNRTAYKSIQQALDSSRNADEVRIAQGVYVTERAGFPVVLIDNRSLVLQGGFDGANWQTPSPGAITIIDGQQAVRGVQVQGNAAITLSELTVTNGNVAQFGGTVYSGGGIYSGDFNSVIALNNVIVSNNHASSEGGGMYTAGIAVLRNTYMIGNVADGRGGGLVATWADVDGGSFERNTGAFGSGGLNISKEIILSNTRIISNTGGGVSVMDRATIYNTAVIGNTNFGLAQEINTAGRVDITGGTFARNSATAIKVIGSAALTDTLVINNTSAENGAGIMQYSPTGSVRIIGGRFEGNEAADGGGLWVAGKPG
jgi:hypothetical protein